MKILFAIKTIKKSKGGAERVLLDIANGLSTNNEISLLTFDSERGIPLYPVDDGINTIYLNSGDAGAKAGYYETAKRIQLIRRHLKKHKPDIIIAFLHSMFVPMAIAKLGFNIPFVASEHIVPHHYAERRVEYILMIAAGLLSNRITVLSEKTKNMYPWYLRNRMFSMPNPVMFPEKSPAYEDMKKNAGVILNIGRLDPQKDQECLIKAFALLAGKYPEWQLRIIGEGMLLDKLRSLVKEMELAERVVFPGVVHDISSEYLSADIFAMSSSYESFGLVTAEAMAHGLAVVGFGDCPGTNELIVNNENGLLVNGSDRAVAFSRGLEKLILSAQLRKQLGIKAKASVVKFNKQNVLQSWTTLINEASNI